MFFEALFHGGDLVGFSGSFASCLSNVVGLHDVVRDVVDDKVLGNVTLPNRFQVYGVWESSKLVGILRFIF